MTAQCNWSVLGPDAWCTHHASSNVDLADALVPTVGDVNGSVGESDVTKLVKLGGGAHAVDRPTSSHACVAA